ncbi:MAG TPA: hypothetical protein VGB97_01315 [Candidatus Paceibacterota bacterium]|jgi:hypothetical protein
MNILKGSNLLMGVIGAGIIAAAVFMGSPRSEKAEEYRLTHVAADRAVNEFRCNQAGFFLAADGTSCKDLNGNLRPIPVASR